jgi:hypothetical protein
MSEIVPPQDASSSESSREYRIASYYTNGDEARARQMMAGDLKDICVIKAKFHSTTSTGAFIIFFNHLYLSLNSVFPVIAGLQSFHTLDPEAGWTAFEENLRDSVSKNEHDDVLCSHFKNALVSSFSLQFAGEIQKLIQTGDKEKLGKFFMLFVQDRLGFQRIKMNVSFELISSLDMELNSLTSRKIIEFRERKDDKEEVEPHIELDEGDEEVLREKDVRLVLVGSLILAPVKGRDIGLLIVGDRIQVKIIDSNPKAIQVAKAFNAYDEDGFHPITGRIVSIRHRADGGYKIFVLIAKGIFVMINEIEENIKVSVDMSFMDNRQRVEEIPKVSIAVIAALSIVLLSLVALMIFYLM